MDFSMFQERFLLKWNQINKELEESGEPTMETPNLVELAKLFISHYILHEFENEEIEKFELEERGASQ